MPIINFTDHATISRQALPVPVLAMCKKGAEKPERGVGRNLGHFRFDWSDLRAKEVFESMYGPDKQHELLITVLSDEVDAVLDSSYRLYGANNLMKRKCDGCTIIRAQDLPEGSPCVCDPAKRDSDDYKLREGQCSPKGFFYFTLPDLCKALGYLGQFVLTTGSLYEMRDIATILHTVKQTSGRLLAQPFLLRRTEKSYNVKGKNMTQWNVEIIPPINLVISGLDTPILGAPNVAALPSGESLDERDYGDWLCPSCGNRVSEETAISLGMECPDCGASFVHKDDKPSPVVEDAGAPQTKHFEAPERDINDVDSMIGTTPPVVTEEQRFMLDLIEIINPMCNHENHARNVIAKAIEEGKFVSGDSLDKAAYKIFERRCDSRWGLSPAELPAKVEAALGMGLKAYFKDNPRDYAGVWGAMVEACKDLEDIPF